MKQQTLLRSSALALILCVYALTLTATDGQAATPNPTQRALALTQAWVSYQATLAALDASPITLVPLTPRFDLMTQNAAQATANQATRDAFAAPTATAVPAQIGPVQAITPLSITVYAQGTVNVRSCASRTCQALGTVSPGQAIPVNAYTNGEAVRNGNATWYRFGFNGSDGYIYSEYVSDQPAPTAPPPPAPAVLFQGSNAQVIGPLTIGPGLYLARVTTSGFFIAVLQVVSGNCGSGTYFLTPYIFNLMGGDANGAEATIKSEGCSTFIEISNISAPWRLEIQQIG